ncbi:MAG TPA: TIGR03086 family metal-binding protein [Pseudonocardia sp.]|nr:TIGR03086 family metal-binding protein [Pseudonocardia sp.]
MPPPPDQLLDAHGRAMADFDRLVRAVPADRWDSPTPCAEWSVRDLVEHLVTEQLWVPPLLAGQTIAEVGDRFAGDPLGADPVAAWRAGAETARLAWLEPGVLDRSVHLSYGTDSAVNYGWQMILDLAVHAWDLSVGSSGDRADDPAGDPYRIPDDLAEVLFAIFAPLIPQWREFGIFDPPVPVPADADPHTRLLGLLGRKP